MKKLNLLTLGAATCALLLSPAVLRAGVLGSPHDFSAEAWNVKPGDQNSVCGACHQPHNANSSVVPLWSHATSVGPWIMYNTANVPTSDLQSTPDASPTGVSLACLSCHDGTVAVNTYGGQTWGGSGVYVTNSARIGPDLTHTHPISLTYDPNLAGNGVGQDKWLFNPDTTPVLTPDSGPFVAGNDMTVNGFLLNGNNRLECSSCHDVHNQEGSPFDINLNPKLVKIAGTKAGKGSLLCRSCHNK